MRESGIAAIVFLCLVGASFGAMKLSPKLPARHRDDDTNAVVRLVANIFVIMSSLVFGLMINSARSTYETVDRSLHAYATELILFDHALRDDGAEAAPARMALAAYVEEALRRPLRADDSGAYDTAGRALEAVGAALGALPPANGRTALTQQYLGLVSRRWALVEQSEGAIPRPLIWLLTTWMTLIFASFGYRAPQNRVVAACFLASATLIAAGFYLVLNMSVPFDGPIQASDAPLRRALAEMKM